MNFNPSSFWDDAELSFLAENIAEDLERAKPQDSRSRRKGNGDGRSRINPSANSGNTKKKKVFVHGDIYYMRTEEVPRFTHEIGGDVDDEDDLVQSSSSDAVCVIDDDDDDGEDNVVFLGELIRGPHLQQHGRTVQGKDNRLEFIPHAPRKESTDLRPAQPSSDCCSDYSQSYSMLRNQQRRTTPIRDLSIEVEYSSSRRDRVMGRSHLYKSQTRSAGKSWMPDLISVEESDSLSCGCRCHELTKTKSAWSSSADGRLKRAVLRHRPERRQFWDAVAREMRDTELGETATWKTGEECQKRWDILEKASREQDDLSA